MDEIKTKKNYLPLIILLIVLIVAAAAIVIVVVSAGGSPKKKYEKQLALAENYVDELDYDKAVAAYRSAIEIDPKRPEAYLALAEVYVKMDDYDSAIAVLTEGYEKSGDENLKKRLDEYGQRQLSTDEPETVAREEEPAAPEKTDEEKPHDFSKVVFPKSAFDYELMGKNWLDWEYDALAANVKTLPEGSEEDGMWSTWYGGTVAQVYQNYGIRFIELYDGVGNVHVEDNLEQNTFLIDLRGAVYEEGGGWLNKCELLGTPAKDFLAQYSPEFAEEVLAFFSDDANESNIGYKNWTLQNCRVYTEGTNDNYCLRFYYNDAGKDDLPPAIEIDKNSFLITSVNAFRFNGKP